MIMPGIKIGDGAVIGSRALVAKDVEPYSIIGGNPAKLIRKRFHDAEIEMLLELKWWNWDDDKLRKAMPILSSGNIKKLYEYYQSFNK